jgi:hypothetical protein
MDEARNPAKVQAVLSELGVPPAELELVRKLPSEAARAKLEELKARVAKNYRKVVFKYHPDRGGDEATFKLVGTIKADFEKLQVQPGAPPPVMRARVVMQPMTVRVVTWSSAGSTYTANNPSVVGIHIGMPLRVATMKPT